MPKISNVFMIELPEQPVLTISGSMPMHEIADFILNGYCKLDSYLKEMGELTTDVPFIAYYDWKKIYTEDIRVSVVFPTFNKLPGNGIIESAAFPPARFLSCYYRGNYQNILSAYDAMEKWARDKDVELTDDCCEFYYNGLEYGDDNSLTKIYLPVRR